MLRARYLFFSGAHRAIPAVSRHKPRPETVAAVQKMVRFHSSVPVVHSQPYYLKLQQIFSQYKINHPSLINYIEELVAKDFNAQNLAERDLEAWLREQLKPSRNNPHLKSPAVWQHVQHIRRRARYELFDEIESIAQAPKRGDKIRAMKLDDVVQHYTDQADLLVPRVAETFLPQPWGLPQAIGTVKHQVAQQLHSKDQETFADYRLNCEISYYLQGMITPYEFREGAVRLDFVTNETHPDAHKEMVIWDSKYGKASLGTKQIQGMLVHGPSVQAIKEVKPSWRGGITTRWAIERESEGESRRLEMLRTPVEESERELRKALDKTSKRPKP